MVHRPVKSEGKPSILRAGRVGVVFGMLRAAWADSRLREIPAAVEGTPPASFVLGETCQK